MHTLSLDLAIQLYSMADIERLKLSLDQTPGIGTNLSSKPESPDPTAYVLAFMHHKDGTTTYLIAWEYT